MSGCLNQRLDSTDHRKNDQERRRVQHAGRRQKRAHSYNERSSANPTRRLRTTPPSDPAAPSNPATDPTIAGGNRSAVSVCRIADQTWWPKKAAPKNTIARFNGAETINRQTGSRQAADGHRHLARAVQRDVVAHQKTTEPAAREAAASGERVRNPTVIPDLPDVEAARGAEIFGQPGDEKIPGPIAQKFGEDQTPDLPVAQQAPIGKADLPLILDDGVLKVAPFGGGDEPMPPRLVVQIPPGPGPDKPGKSGRQKRPSASCSPRQSARSEEARSSNRCSIRY